MSDTKGIAVLCPGSSDGSHIIPVRFPRVTRPGPARQLVHKDCHKAGTGYDDEEGPPPAENQVKRTGRGVPNRFSLVTESDTRHHVPHIFPTTTSVPSQKRCLLVGCWIFFFFFPSGYGHICLLHVPEAGGGRANLPYFTHSHTCAHANRAHKTEKYVTPILP